MPKHASSKTSSRALREPEYASSSTAAPFDPTGKGPERKMPYGGGKSAHSRGESALRKVAPHPEEKSFMSSHGGKAAYHGQAPPASTLQGSLGIIEHVSTGGKKQPMGIPGILTSTSLGPEQRQRLVSGIIESGMGGEAAEGPVHKILGHDSTAYNQGMIHLRGSSFM